MTSNFTSHFNLAWLNKLLATAEKPVYGHFAGMAYQAKIIIPNYKQRITHFYNQTLKSNLDKLCKDLDIPLVFQHFGLELKFETPMQLRLHNTEMLMPDNLHQIIKEIGVVIIKNAYLDSEHRDMGHRNRFPQLNFHVDRSEKQPTHYSMYTRNPFDAEQKEPRLSSTLFVAKIIGHLQTAKEKNIDPNNPEIKKGSYQIFTKEDMSTLIDNIIIEHAWDEPQGTGEISMLDNINCLHASYYRHPTIKGYKIGVRYVG